MQQQRQSVARSAETIQAPAVILAWLSLGRPAEWSWLARWTPACRASAFAVTEPKFRILDPLSNVIHLHLPRTTGGAALHGRLVFVVV